MSNLLTKLINYRNDPLGFIEEFVYYKDVRHGYRQISLTVKQKEIIRDILLSGDNEISYEDEDRQIGKTTAFISALTHYITYNTDKTIIILASKHNRAVDILYSFAQMYEYLPDVIKNKIVKQTKSFIEFDNGCRIYASSISSSSLRGLCPSMVYIDESQFVSDREHDNFSKMYEPVYRGLNSKIIKLSSPR